MSLPTLSTLSLASSYIPHRLALFSKIQARRLLELAQRQPFEITINLPNGTTQKGQAYVTKPIEIAEKISNSLAKRAVIAEVNGKLWDLTRPLEEDCSLQILDFESEKGKMVFWHSSAHVLGEACENHYGCNLCIGPPIEEGFYYEMSMTGEQKAILDSDRKILEEGAKLAIKEKQVFERLEMTKDELREMFKHNEFKLRLIESKVPETGSTVYKCGPFIDLCYGPHIPDTGRIKALAVTKASSSYWLGDQKNEALQRVYGISFPSTKEMTEWKKFQEEAAQRDHRKIGIAQELFFFNEISPGSCFWLPHGTRIYNTLVEYIKKEYWRRGFTEVITPNIYSTKLWEQSGHWQKYQENMFAFESEKETFALKPMNCPGHCVLFGSRDRSYRDLPLRLAEFGVLHRNEASGALTGLTRVRRFVQDDAHIFCRMDQIEHEISECLAFLRTVYGIFGFQFSLKLSTRPDNYLGEIETWNVAEKMLKDSLEEFAEPWEIEEGDGAFYGPKIDIKIQDALRRKHQCATIQLDFQLPERFDLTYVSNNQDASVAPPRPVIIHRAILGSVERMVAILTENFAGRWPVWLSPRQICVIPVAATYNDYCTEVQQIAHNKGFFADTDLSDNTLKKKIRNAQVAQYNFIFVVGEDEMQKRAVNVRSRDAEVNARAAILPLEDVIAQIQGFKDSYTTTAIIDVGLVQTPTAETSEAKAEPEADE